MNRKLEKYLSKIFRALGSLKLAVLVILALATITAIGTFYEANYSAYVAKKLIYESFWMYAVMGLLIISLVFSAVERYPWKRKHTGFLLAHTGIIIIILGSYITQRAGLDASLALSIGEKSQFVILPYERVLAFYETSDGVNYRKRGQSSIDFTKSKPSKNSPYIVQKNPYISIVDYWPYADRKSSIIPSSSQNDGPAIQFQLFNNAFNVSQWLIKRSSLASESIDLGPVKIVLADSTYTAGSGNEIVITPDESPKKFRYFLFKKEGMNEDLESSSKRRLLRRAATMGVGLEGEEIQTEWMGLKFKVLSYFPLAKEKVTYSQRDKPIDSSVPVLHVEYKNEKHTLGLNSILKLFDDEKAYVLTYNNKRVSLGFPIKLKSFEVKKYPGSQKAMSYESVLMTPDGRDTLVSMNEPLKYDGYTFYQASFQEDELGKPIASIFTVNYDPGRWVKYLGSLLLIGGILVLFYMKGYFGRKVERV